MVGCEKIIVNECRRADLILMVKVMGIRLKPLKVCVVWIKMAFINGFFTLIAKRIEIPAALSIQTKTEGERSVNKGCPMRFFFVLALKCQDAMLGALDDGMPLVVNGNT